MKATYQVYFTDENGVEDIWIVKAGSAGEAFADCLKKNPKGKLIKAVREGKVAGGFGRTEFLPPPKYL